MIDSETLRRWIGDLDFEVTTEPGGALRVSPCGDPPRRAAPGLCITWGPRWIQLTVLLMWPRDEPRLDRIYTRMLHANRDLRIAKLALTRDGEIVLAAELPTESLQLEEFADAVARILRYATTWRASLGAVVVG